MLHVVEGSCREIVIIFKFTIGIDCMTDTGGELGTKSWVMGRTAQCD